MRPSYFALTALSVTLLACAAENEPSSNASADMITDDAGPACKPKSPTAPPTCIEIYQPVCGCDGKTYGNSCEAAGYVSTWTDGACPATDAGTACKLKEPTTPAYCAEVYQPVCGCDGKTYGNACEAGYSVSTWVDGACK